MHRKNREPGKGKYNSDTESQCAAVEIICMGELWGRNYWTLPPLIRGGGESWINMAVAEICPYHGFFQMEHQNAVWALVFSHSPFWLMFGVDRERTGWAVITFTVCSSKITIPWSSSFSHLLLELLLSPFWVGRGHAVSAFIACGSKIVILRSRLHFAARMAWNG